MIFANVTDWTIPEGSVERVADSLGIVIWEKEGHNYSKDYFFIENLTNQNNTLSITKKVANAPTITVYKSTDTVNWESMGSTSTTGITATIPANGRLYLKATTNSWAVAGANNNNVISGSGYFNVGGNIMSLIAGDNFRNATLVDGTNDYAFSNIFNNQYVIDASNLVFPNTVAYSCYYRMFDGCTSLATAPALPATRLTHYCYYGMFDGCTSLTTAPELPATTLAQYCYGSMFWGCKSLTTAPSLPATTLAEDCYYCMFNSCKSLTTAPALPATTLTTGCYNSMFSHCTSLTTAPSLPATRLTHYCYYGMFYECTSLTTAPELPATTLAQHCYSLMFKGCHSLTTAPATLPATTLTLYCYQSMFDGCTSLTTAPSLPAATLASNCYYNMFYGCSNLSTVTTYADDISASSCLNNWLNGVAATGDFYNLGSATYTSGASGIPTGWTEHTS